MKKILVIALMAAVVLAGCKKDDPAPTPLEIDLNITDAAFLAYCKAQTDWDTNNDGRLTTEEAAAFRSFGIAAVVFLEG